MPAVATLAILVTIALGGCSGGNSSTSGGSGAQTTEAPAQATEVPTPAVSPTLGAQGHHHRHRHHHHGAYGTGVAGSGAAGSGGAGAAASPGLAVSGAPSGRSWACNDAQFLTDQQQFASGTLSGDQEVDVCGPVTRVLREKDTRSGEHGYFYIQVAAGDVIKIVSDLGDMDAPAWPWVKVGDYCYVQGRYYYDSASSQGIDWTHHGTSSSWPSPGYVVVAGTEYQ